MRLFFAIFAAASVFAAAEPYPGFWKQWGDSQAELAGYDLVARRDGHPRNGTAVAIFVSEPFPKSLIKTDPGKHPPSDKASVIKLNLIKDLPAGIYDFNETMTALVDISTGNPVKLSFSRQDWKGSIYQQVLFDAPKLFITAHSYLDGEADQQRELRIPQDSVSEDTLPLIARGMAQPYLKPGGSKLVRMMTALGTLKGSGGPVQWVGVTLSRSARSQKITVPAGTFDAELWTAAMALTYKHELWIEKGGEGRLLKWQTSSGEKAELIRSARMKYWEMNSPAGQAALEKIGLKPRPARTM